MPDDAPALAPPPVEAAIHTLADAYDGLQASLRELQALGHPPAAPSEHAEHAARAAALCHGALISLTMMTAKLAFYIRQHSLSQLN